MPRRRTRPTLRVVSLLAVFVFAFGVVGLRLVHLQVVAAPALKERAQQQHVRSVELPADRGQILDRNSDPLAVSTEAYAVHANPILLRKELRPQDLELIVDQVADALGLSRRSVAERLASDAGFVYLGRRVDPDIARSLDELPHIGLIYEPRRAYPSEDTGIPILGLVNVDNDGQSGVERAMDRILAGSPGRRVLERDLEGRPIPQGVSSVVEPEPGRDVILSIDRDLQYLAEDALRRGSRRTKATRGTAVVLDARTGEVLAMANLNGTEAEDDLIAARRNRVVTDMYEPGSVFKVITASAALQHGEATPQTRLTVPYRMRVSDSIFRDFAWHPTQRMTYAEALARSSNVATIKIAQRVGERRLFQMMRDFGVGKRTGIDFPGEAAGIVPELQAWSGTSIATIPIGQGVAVTPLQLAGVYQTIANDGVRIPPRLVRGSVDDAGVFTPAKRPRARRVIDPFVAAQVRGMLVGAVETGTGARAQLPGYLVGGKTGTAFIPKEGQLGYSKRIHTTFAGIAPADDPRVVVVVQLEDPTPRLASATAAPVFAEIMSAALVRLGVPPNFEPDRAISLRALRAPTPRATLGAMAERAAEGDRASDGRAKAP